VGGPQQPDGSLPGNKASANQQQGADPQQQGTDPQQQGTNPQLQGGNPQLQGADPGHGTPSSSSTGAAPPPGPIVEATFLHTATTANSTYDWTDLDNSLTNNNPAAVVFATPNWSPPGGTGLYDNHAIGVWYHDGRWAVFNQDRTVIPAGAAFNIHVWSGSTGTVLVHSATSGNIVRDYTTIDHAASNNQLSALVWVTPTFAPAKVYDNHPIGVFYTNGRWSVYHQDQSTMAVSTAYNVAIGSNGAEAAYVHTATAGNSVNNYTDLDNVAFNGHPNAMLFVTPNWNPAGGSGVYDNHNIGVWYHNGHWSVFHQDQTPIPAGAAFNIMAYGG
jgi:hypothetical protein